ncbi:MAG TPA: amidohydrolase family protein [Dehalococcoidia bacterium]|nr:amidohydrolase family protein [Dehalococcoidia bacterium]
MSEQSTTGPAFDLIVRRGSVCDGSGGEPYAADVAVAGDRIAVVAREGDLRLAGARAEVVIDAAGMAVAPGFINMLSHSYITMLHDGRSLGELKQGVTTQIFGEGTSMGPLTDQDRRRLQGLDPALDYRVEWRSLAEYLQYAEKHGISQNVASYIGATTLRTYAAGHANRPLTAGELDTVRGLIREEMVAGALGVGSALIYPPGFFSDTDELVALCAAAAPYQGKYISHMRSEGLGLLQGVDELIRIAREGGVPAEIYHLKASGRESWPLMADAIARVERARAEGLRITADMYTYTAGATGLSNCIPPWFHEGGQDRLVERLGDAAVRREIREAIETTSDGWENLYRAAGDPENILLLQTRSPDLRHHQGKTLAAVARAEGKDPIETIFDLVAQDRSRIGTAYFMMSDENVRLGLSQPWVSLGSDAGSMAAEGAFLLRSTHPRAYGNFARYLGKYVREERLAPLGEAVRRLSRLPAENLGLAGRGRIEEGCFADLVVFDPVTIADRATYENPHQYAVGVRDVIVNGRAALRDGEFAGHLPGRALHGPGRSGRA